MNAVIKFEPFEPTFGPERPLSCADGWESHEWQLSIEEGQASIISDCVACNYGVNESEAYINELLEMEPIRVRLEFFHEPGQPWYGVDPTWYWSIEPVSPVEDER